MCLDSVAGVVSGRLNERSVLEWFLQGDVTMAEVLHFTLLLLLNCGSLGLVSTGPADDTTAVNFTVDSASATVLLLSAEKTRTPNSTDIPTTGFTTSFPKSTTKPPTSSKHLTRDSGKTSARAIPKKQAKEEGPVELGECYFIF